MYLSSNLNSFVSWLIIMCLMVANILCQSSKIRNYQLNLETKEMVSTMSNSLALMQSQQETLILKIDKMRDDLYSNIAHVDEIVNKIDKMKSAIEMNVQIFSQMQALTDEHLRKLNNIMQFSYDVMKDFTNSTRRNESSSINMEDLRKVVSEEMDLIRSLIEKNVKLETSRSVKEINSQIDNVISMVADVQEKSGPNWSQSSRLSPEGGSGLGKIENMIKYRFGEMKHLLENVNAECKNVHNNSNQLFRSVSEFKDNSKPIINHTVSYQPCRDINPKTNHHNRNLICSKDHNVIAPKSCAQIFQSNGTCSDSYILWIGNSVRTFCDMDDNGGWTVIMRRGKFSDKSKRYDFKHEWIAYKQGFGDSMDELWLGNEKIYRLTNDERQLLKIELFSYSGRCVRLYFKDFKVLSEADNYRLIVGQPINCDYHVANLFLNYNNSDFVTADRWNNQRLGGCNLDRSKIGWWINSERCNDVHLTGTFREEIDSFVQANEEGITWYSFEANKSLKSVQMSIRPMDFNPFKL